MMKNKGLKLYLPIFITIMFVTILCLNVFNVFGQSKKIMGGIVSYDELPLDKQQAADKAEKLISDSASKPPASQDKNKTVIYDVGPVQDGSLGFRPGIQMRQSFSSTKYKITSAWVGNLNGTPTIMGTGYKLQNPKQGVLVVLQSEKKPAIKEYSTKGPDGALYFVNQDGNVFTLSTNPSNVNPGCYSDEITNQINGYSGAAPIIYTFDASTNTFNKLKAN